MFRNVERLYAILAHAERFDLVPQRRRRRKIPFKKETKSKKVQVVESDSELDDPDFVYVLPKSTVDESCEPTEVWEAEYIGPIPDDQEVWDPNSPIHIDLDLIES